MNKDNIMNEINSKSDIISNYPWHDKAFYSEWLAQTYYFVWHSTRLLNYSAAHMNKQQEPLYKRFMEHVGEESFHEKLASQDIKVLKRNISEFSENISTKSFYRNQYYLIDKVSPLSLLGYILFLEGIAIVAGKQIYKTVSEHFSLRAGSFLKVHAEEDEEHLEEAFKLIFTLEQGEKDIILENFFESSDIYIKMLDEILEKTSLQRDQKQAA